MPKHAYSLADRCLHWLALEPAIVRALSFDLERQFALPRRNKPRVAGSGVDPADRGDPAAGAVYVCGLARSGTTMLLRLLDQVDELRSLSYRDKPFPLAPSLWRRFTSFSPKPAVAAERIHGDGMLVDFDSPEGFEEVFWRTFTPYSTSEGVLSAQEPSEEVLAEFADYRALVANPRGKAGDDVRRRYLSKNNNNLLRLRRLSNEPSGCVVFVFRSPAAAALSMHRTHASFSSAQSNDPYLRRYMRWLCHHEFGLDHRPFEFAASRMDRHLTPDRLDYWLDYWCAVHEHVLEVEGSALRLLDYDALCREPETTLGLLFRALGLEVHGAALSSQVAARRPSSDVDFEPALLRRALGIHQSLRERSGMTNRNLAL